MKSRLTMIISHFHEGALDTFLMNLGGGIKNSKNAHQLTLDQKWLMGSTDLLESH